MDITYLGISSFKLKTKTTTVVIDPYDDSTGLKFPKIEADMVISSHGHKDHNAVEKVSGTANRPEPLVINAPGEYEASGVSVFGIASYHDDNRGAERGRNTIFVVHIDELVIAHLGDLGHSLSRAQVEEVNGVDVLMVPVGGVYTIDARTALKVIDQVEPNLVIPMHYKDKGMSQVFDGLISLDEFFSQANIAEARREKKLNISKATLPEEREVVVLERYG